MSGNGASFSQITPLTPRVVGIDYVAVPKPGQYHVPYYLYPLLEDAEFASENGTATLVGISEYTTPSSPPKKYLKQVLSGASVVCAIPAPGPIPPTYEVRSYSGQYEYDPDTGLPTNNQLRQDRNQAGGACGGTPPVTGTAVPALSPWFSDYAVPSAWSHVLARITDTYTGIAGFIAFFCQSTSGVSVATLTDEDTEDNAIARSTPSGSGVSPESYKETRGAADFTFLWQNSIFSARAVGLAANTGYIVTLDILTENYGGGSPVNSQLTYNFTATADHEDISIPIPAASGKQVTASNPRIGWA